MMGLTMGEGEGEGASMIVVDVRGMKVVADVGVIGGVGNDGDGLISEAPWLAQVLAARGPRTPGSSSAADIAGLSVV
jgi:hypothetical protein